MARKLSIPSTALPLSRARRAGQTVYVSGAIGSTSDWLIPDAVEEEMALAIANLGSSLEEVGSSLEEVIRVGVYLTDQQYFPVMNEVYARHFAGPVYPARSAIVTALAVPELRFELDAVAWSGGTPSASRTDREQQ